MPLKLSRTGLSSPAYRDWAEYTALENGRAVKPRVARKPATDWYVWADAGTDGGPPNNWLSRFGGAEN